jgi:hypothetical protein
MLISEEKQRQIINRMIETFGDQQAARIKKGVQQVTLRWQESDGSAEELENFCREYFITDEEILAQTFARFEQNLESLFGNLQRIYRDFNWMLHVDAGVMLKIDNLFAGYDVYAHVQDDFFKTRLAFVILLNYPIYRLEEKSAKGAGWQRKKWAEARLTEIFAERVPAEVSQQRTKAYTVAEEYIYHYNIPMHNLLMHGNTRLFPQGLNLISHWGLRDELKGQYANPDEQGPARQEMIQKIMERVITQEIPRQVINNPEVDWNPFMNEIFERNNGKKLTAQPESLRRYESLWNIFEAEKKVDPFTKDMPSLIDRKFKREREIAESEVEAILKTVLSAPVLKDIAELIQKRLRRPLRPYDIWYTGFKAGSGHPEEELDRIVAKTFPTLEALQEKLGTILQKLGFSKKKADYLQRHIQVDPSRGAGHAMGARMRGDYARLRTRVPKGGMNYKGFNTAMHELGHTVEQVFSLNDVDFYTLEGVPNTAFTEAFAFVFQERDLEVLGLASQNDADSSARDMRMLRSMWQTFEIAGVSLLDMYIWRWMYANPHAGAGVLKDAVIGIARGIWNAYYAPVLGHKDQILPAIYSHLIYCGMYTPDYALGHIIAVQIEEFLRSRNLAEAMERMCRLGRIAPQVWMQQAVSASVSPQPLIEAAEGAVKRILATES